MTNPTTAQAHVVQGSARSYRVFLVAGEHSGDALGAKLMAALNERLYGRVRYLGVGGHQMERHGLVSQFPLADICVMGPLAILKRLPLLRRRVLQTVAAAVAAEPDIVVVIDAPEFTHAVASRIRKRRPAIPIIDYVSPTVWAWRPGRAKVMARYCDHVLALWPFEPAAHHELGGPACTYVGHPFLERIPAISALDPAPFASAHGLDTSRPILLVLPGSRRTEVERLMDVFGDAVVLIAKANPGLQVLIPAMPNVRPMIEAKLKGWPAGAGQPLVFAAEHEEDKLRAFKLARAALAASGTVSLELALTRTPMVVAYRVDTVISMFRHLIKAKTCVLPNLITGERAIPEFLQEACTAEALAEAISAVMRDGPERAAQLAEIDRVPAALAIQTGTPSQAAAAVVVAMLER
jgi:lipid-A-disaccharide synthase